MLTRNRLLLDRMLVVIESRAQPKEKVANEIAATAIPILVIPRKSLW